MENRLDWRRRGPTRAGLGVLCAALLLGCPSKDKKKVSGPTDGDTSTMVPQIDPTLCETEGKELVTFDLNRDDKPDVWKLYKLGKEGGVSTRFLTCKQVDLDHDGKKDYVVAFTQKGTMVFEKFDLTFDGYFDAFRKYEEQPGEKESLLYEVQRDSDFDGQYDLTEKYCIKPTDVNPCRIGDLIGVQRDSNGDRKPDVWEQYDKGELVAILYDDAPYDGKVDRREEIVKPAPQQDTAGGDEGEPGSGSETTDQPNKADDLP